VLSSTQISTALQILGFCFLKLIAAAGFSGGLPPPKFLVG
jgi:hypothetical protein